jgi:hypothetical protein
MRLSPKEQAAVEEEGEGLEVVVEEVAEAMVAVGVAQHLMTIAAVEDGKVAVEATTTTAEATTITVEEEVEEEAMEIVVVEDMVAAATEIVEEDMAAAEEEE